ncbi:MAG: phosphosulfolactate synthase [Acidimicrobiia bacterium]|nr:phosphosulfolactate synthase [Acidimicrobiia bacterium]
MAPNSEKPTFLTTPARSTKPRTSGLTHVLDKGMPLENLRALMPSVAELVDVWKFGWGTAYLDPEVADKIAELRTHDVNACTGGTLMEIADGQGRATEFFDWSASVGFAHVEVSNGATGMPVERKRELISEANRHGFEVMSEVGSKDPEEQATPQEWIDEILGDIAAGAAWVVAEGRESGTVGLYDADGQVRLDLVEAIERAVDGTKLIYEAPHRSQQAWLIRTIGPHVNLGNISLGEIMSVESLRLGLRTDTIGIGTATTFASQVVG